MRINYDQDSVLIENSEYSDRTDIVLDVFNNVVRLGEDGI